MAALDSSNDLASMRVQWSNFYYWHLALNPLFMVPKSFHDKFTLYFSSASGFLLHKDSNVSAKHTLRDLGWVWEYLNQALGPAFVTMFWWKIEETCQNEGLFKF